MCKFCSILHKELEHPHICIQRGTRNKSPGYSQGSSLRGHTEVTDTLVSLFGFCVIVEEPLLSNRINGEGFVKHTCLSCLIVGMGLGTGDRTIPSASGCGWQSHQGIFDICTFILVQGTPREHGERRLSMSLAYAYIPKSMVNRVSC